MLSIRSVGMTGMASRVGSSRLRVSAFFINDSALKIRVRYRTCPARAWKPPLQPHYVHGGNSFELQLLASVVERLVGEIE